MATNGKHSGREIQLRRYPNRRYYDATRSRYVTLQEIYTLILDGNDVQVTDAKTGEDITAKVLAQIILEHDAPKLQIFPIQLLHQLIRTNELLVRGFVESFFGNALLVFMESQRLFDRYLRIGLGDQHRDRGKPQQATAPRNAAVSTQDELEETKPSVHSPAEDEPAAENGADSIAEPSRPEPRRPAQPNRSIAENTATIKG